jgi:L-alanine-DL-glutamate epimerase-like enolase superfamily enzyme
MTIRAIETVRTDTHANLIWLRVEDDAGRIGTGETFFAPGAVEAYLHDVVALDLVGRTVEDIAAINARLIRPPVGYGASSVELRAASALDIALWDLLGQRAGLPVAVLLGGCSRREIAIYNTCAGPGYVTRPREAGLAAWFDDGAGRHPLDDLYAFEHDPVGLARSLLAEGVTAMKIWPFDRAAFARGGVGISPADVAAGLKPFQAIRDAVGDAMALAVELHALWDLASARRIIRAVEAIDPIWIEDPVRMDDAAALSTLAEETRLPILGSETLAPAASFLPLIEARALGIVCCDPSWCGGLSQARVIADLAAAAQLPFAVHDCTGPIGFVAGTHLSLHAPTAMIQETVRAYVRGWYADVVTALPPIEHGVLHGLSAPGLGTALQPAFLAATTTHLKRTTIGGSS